MGIRTDIAEESLKKEQIDNFFCEKNGKFELHFAEILNENESRKPKGKYATIYFENIEKITDFTPLEKQFEKALKMLCKPHKNVLVAGLGNREITADSIGVKTAEKILATRHIAGEFSKKIGLENLKSVSVIVPNVLGKTGIEVLEILRGIIDKTGSDLLIVIDALCAGDKSRIFRTIQLTDSGIAPGSGVKNKRKEISKNTVNIDVIAIGVPTVIEYPSDNENLIVTPKECDILTDKLSEIIAKNLNIFLQPDIDPEILFQLV